MMFKPRDYQENAEESVWRFIHTPANYGKNPLVVAATGVGKSLMMAMSKWRLMASYPHVRILNITHVKELVEGNFNTLVSLWPEAPAGVFSSGLGVKDSSKQITFCGIQSVVKRPATFGHIDFVYIDEAHRMSPNDATSYGKFINALRAVNPNLVVIGFTATDFRMKGGRLTELGLFDEVVYDIGSGESFLWLIKQGYLCNLVPAYPGFEVDESQIRIQAGDYRADEASAAWKDQGLLERAVDYQIGIAKEQGRKCWLNFCQSIDDAELVAEMMTMKGYPVEAVHSKRSDRDDVIKDLKKGHLVGITNKDVLTTGFDHPPIDLIGMLRLTRSPGLWIQMLGRGTRPFFVNHRGHNGGPPLHDISTVEGRLASIAESPKQNCLVLDFAGNTKRLGPINYPNVPAKRKKGAGGEPPVRTCHQCEPNTYHHVSVKVCPECGFEFPPPETFKATAGTDELVLDLASLPPPPELIVNTYTVHEVVYERHTGKGGKPDTVRAGYRSGFESFSKWICFGHPDDNFGRKAAIGFWKKHGGQGEAPRDIDEALEKMAELPAPKFIKVRTGGQFIEVLDFDMEGTGFDLNLTGEKKLLEPDPDPVKAVFRPVEYEDDDIPF